MTTAKKKNNEKNAHTQQQHREFDDDDDDDKETEEAKKTNTLLRANERMLRLFLVFVHKISFFSVCAVVVAAVNALVMQQLQPLLIFLWTFQMIDF